MNMMLTIDYPILFTCILGVNIDISACINFREIMKMGNFVSIKIRVLIINGSLWNYKRNFREVDIFADI